MRLSPRKAGYTKRWERVAKGYLTKHPVCAQAGRHPNCTLMATQVDHIKPHRGDMYLFWDRTNWQGLCIGCHARKTRADQGLRERGWTDASGMPIGQPDHHWND
jgi:5-methylcytosine-specific restriction protein A